MQRKSWLQLIGVSVVVPVALLIVYVVQAYPGWERGARGLRDEIALFVVRNVESAPYSESIRRYSGYQQDLRLLGVNLWVVSESGEIVASNTAEMPPEEWRRLPKPERVHEVVSPRGFLNTSLRVVLIRLDDPSPRFLILAPKTDVVVRKTIGIRLASAMFFLAVATFFSLFWISLYLRRKSHEARDVLRRLEMGDLKARFEIKRFDETGRLMLDFNRMAAEIEHLVNRIHETEKTRRELLAELGHDLRTPLTSLRASVETMLNHLDEMPKAEQREFLSLMQGEILYFIRLIEGLFFVADMVEPRYRASTRQIDLKSLLQQEVGARNLSKSEFKWSFVSAETPTIVPGDPQLIQRLFKNALDNAAKYARSRVQIALTKKGKLIEATVEDDGPGISPAAAAQFGQRKHQRTLAQGSDLSLSLGLGSVIMRAILHQHGGRLRIEPIAGGAVGPSGTRLTIEFPVG